MVQNIKNYYPLNTKEKELVDLLERVISETLNTGYLFSKVNTLNYCTGRAIFCWLLNKYSFFGNMSEPKIASIMGRDSQTAKKMIKNHEDWYYTNSEYRVAYHKVGAAYSKALNSVVNLNE